MTATTIRRSMPFGLALLLAACVGPTQPRPAAPPPLPAPTPSPTPAPAPTPVAQGGDWRDWPLTPGDWHYVRTGARSEARFGEPGGEPALLLSCQGGRIRLFRTAHASAAGPLRIRTSSGDVARPAQLSGGMLETDIPATDPTLDQLAFSRGRFMLMTAGSPDLIVPAWPEVSRVIEDCRS